MDASASTLTEVLCSPVSSIRGTMGGGRWGTMVGCGAHVKSCTKLVLVTVTVFFSIADMIQEHRW